MKIALIHIKHAGDGGIEKYLNNLSSYLADKGHDVTIICRRHENQHHPKVKFVKLKPIAFGPAHRIWTFAKAVEKHLQHEKYDVVYGLGKAWSQDIIRLGFGLHETYIKQAHAYSRNPTQIMLGRDRIVNKVELAIERKAFSNPDLKKVIANSKMVADDVKQRYQFSDDQIEVIYNGVDLVKFNPDNKIKSRQSVRAEFGFTEKDFVLLFLGTNYGRKGLDRLLRALPQVVANKPLVKLLVVGYGSRIKEFKALAEKLGVTKRVVFAGGRRDTQALYAASDLFVLPTRFDPFANTTIEAMASGLPVITSVENGANELITNGIEGCVLKNADDSEEFSEVLNVWCDADVAKAGGVCARKLAEKHSIESKMESIFRTLLDLS
ncbi:MAG: glycosyltransferase family 4 protein [Gammaproteobacteria bacterium]|nr:glycosyltransferase family 4 protein [Gammaproteobacteria bacterium]